MSGAVARAGAVVPEPLRERVRLRVAAALERRQRRSGTVRGAAVVFHAVAPTPGNPDLEVDPAVQVERLDEIVGYLARRYQLVRASDLPEAARGRRPGERVPIAFTFDDDLPSHREFAAPVFARHRVPATAFLCETETPFWWQLLQAAIDEQAITPAALPEVSERLVEDAVARRPRAIARLAKAIEELPARSRDTIAASLDAGVASKPVLLDADGAAALARAGWELGFHTRRHDLLTTLDLDGVRAAVERRPSRATGDLPRALAYPHGKAGPREAQAAREAGYSAAFTGYASVLTEGADDHLIGRLQPPTSSVGRFAVRLARTLVAD